MKIKFISVVLLLTIVVYSFSKCSNSDSKDSNYYHDSATMNSMIPDDTSKSIRDTFVVDSIQKF